MVTTFSKPVKPGQTGWQVQVYLWGRWKTLFDQDWPRNIRTYGHPKNLVFSIFSILSLKDNCRLALKKFKRTSLGQLIFKTINYGDWWGFNLYIRHFQGHIKAVPEYVAFFFLCTLKGKKKENQILSMNFIQQILNCVLAKCPAHH